MMTNSENNTLRMANTLAHATVAAFAPDTPNGTTKKLQGRIDAILSRAMDEVYEIVNAPDVPNGTTLKVKRIMEAG